MDRRLLGHFNWPLLLVTLVLDGIGLINLYSAVHVDGGFLPSIFTSQVTFMVVGLGLMALMTMLDYRVYERLAYPMYIAGLVLLTLPLLFGRTISGSQRWLHMGFFSIQPSEIGKILLVLVLSKYFHNDVSNDGYRLRDLWRPFFLLCPMAFLIYVSPDLGTTGFYVLLFLIMAFTARLRWRSIFLLVTLGSLLLPLAYGVLLTDYQRDRVITLLDPAHDPTGKGYQTLQSRYAIGAGRMLGSGYLQGMQTHQGFIPENHTDFIVTVLAEEWGFVGAATLLGLYLFFLVLGLGIAQQAKERFGALLATGLTSIFFLQVVINLGAVLGLLPVTGVTLPLISYGGSSVLTLHLAIGLLLNISMRRYMF